MTIISPIHFTGTHSLGSVTKMACSDLWSCLAFFLAIALIQAEYLGKRFRLAADDPNPEAVKPSLGWIEQRVDNFNPVDDRTWQMRYLNNSQFFKPGGPIFIYVGGEWTINTTHIMSGQIFDLAKKHNGYMFYTEHRFYGESYPINDLTTKSMQYLSADQALADLAYFVQHQKETIPELEKSKVVLVGCSYGGTLATWARIKYPHVFKIAYASSAPLRSVDEFTGYFELIGQVILRNSKRCYDVIKEAIRQTETLLETTDGQKIISKLYNTSSQVKNTEPDRSWFFRSIARVFASRVQSANVTQVADECKQMLSYPGNPLQKVSSYYKSKCQGKCDDNWVEFLRKFASTNKTKDMHRQWHYQCCTGHGNFQMSKSKKQLFGDTIPISLYRSICKDLFGSEYNVDVLHRGIKRTNLFYGSVNPDVTNLITVHGTADPWHLMGLLRNISDTAQTIVIDGTSHCQDTSSLNSTDLPQLKAAKIRAQELIAKWLK